MTQSFDTFRTEVASLKPLSLTRNGVELDGDCTPSLPQLLCPGAILRNPIQRYSQLSKLAQARATLMQIIGWPSFIIADGLEHGNIPCPNQVVPMHQRELLVKEILGSCFGICQATDHHCWPKKSLSDLLLGTTGHRMFV